MRRQSAIARAIQQQLKTPAARAAAIESLAASDPAAARRLAGKAAQAAGMACLAELQHTADVLAYYRQHPDGDCDFVWVEETVDSAMVDAGHGDDRAAYVAACKVVFDWLLATHKVQPPRWFKLADIAANPDARD